MNTFASSLEETEEDLGNPRCKTGDDYKGDRRDDTWQARGVQNERILFSQPQFEVFGEGRTSSESFHSAEVEAEDPFT